MALMKSWCELSSTTGDSAQIKYHSGSWELNSCPLKSSCQLSASRAISPASLVVFVLFAFLVNVTKIIDSSHLKEKRYI